MKEKNQNQKKEKPSEIGRLLIALQAYHKRQLHAQIKKK